MKPSPKEFRQQEVTLARVGGHWPREIVAELRDLAALGAALAEAGRPGRGPMLGRSQRKELA